MDQSVARSLLVFLQQFLLHSANEFSRLFCSDLFCFVEVLCICMMFSEAINSDEVRISLSEGGHPGIL